MKIPARHLQPDDAVLTKVTRDDLWRHYEGRVIDAVDRGHGYVNVLFKDGGTARYPGDRMISVM
ncbi:hypothetical protein K8O93_01040 [Gordonia bronchialis]|uniref:hypothetical protein n=1 Tax=Gordonia bronchialis TaxID=2054 RepID=UPI001CBEF051|nr:hypothetical protein [Gordonia bronchialis]UAK38419.1 hypothetical protein K8O93_01040 [Gordonia bronchialis]